MHSNLKDKGIPAILTLEPGGTPLGTAVRDLLKVKRSFTISPKAELMLFNACRAQLVRDVIKPSLAAGKVVICDRFSDSTVVYQGYARGLDIETIESINNLATDRLKPDLTILLDTDPEMGLGRKHNIQSDRFDNEDIGFHRKVREGYLAEANKDTGRWHVINGQQPVNIISNSILDIVLPRLDSL